MVIPELTLRNALTPEQRRELDLALESPRTEGSCALDDLDPYECAEELLAGVFCWGDTPQGGDYWRRIYSQMRKNHDT